MIREAVVGEYLENLRSTFRMALAFAIHVFLNQ